MEKGFCAAASSVELVNNFKILILKAKAHKMLDDVEIIICIRKYVIGFWSGILARYNVLRCKMVSSYINIILAAK